VPFVYALVVLLWIALVAAEFVFVVPVAIALALVAGFGLGVGRFLQTAWRTLTATGVEGPSPVTRPAPGPPDAAYPHYLLAQLWRDALVLERRTVPWCLTQARWAFSTLTETLLPLPQGLALFPLWFGLCAGIALSVLPLAVAALAFGLAALAMAGAGLAGWSVCVTVLGAVERVWMAYRHILLACPHPGCYRRFALPEYACPRCEERHSRLAPNRLGAFRHVCRCGTRLPTTILLGRFRLGAYCPHCHRRLPGRIGRARVEPLPFVGGPAAGKTTLMFLAVRALRASAAGAQGRAEFVEARDARAYAAAVAELDRGERLAKTGPELPAATMLDLTLPAAHRILYLFDPAGELHTGATHVERLRYLDHGEALLFVIDPFALPELRFALSTDERRVVQDATATSDEDPSDTLQRLLAELRSRDDQGRQRRIAVVVTKADVLRRTAVGGGLDGDARAWLDGLGLGNTIRTLERTAGEVRYFASGLDTPPAALAELFGWAAGLPLGGRVDPAFDDRPAADELREPWPVAGRPPELIPYGHQTGRSALFAALTVLGPLLMVLAGLSVYARFR
jgi:Double-GTPase 2